MEWPERRLILDPHMNTSDDAVMDLEVLDRLWQPDLYIYNMTDYVQMQTTRRMEGIRYQVNKTAMLHLFAPRVKVR